MNTLHQNSLEKSESKNFSFKPILGKIITGVSLATSVLIADGIKNDAKADIDIRVFTNIFSKNYAVNGLKLVKNIENSLVKNDIKRIKIIIDNLNSDLGKIELSKTEEIIKKTEEIKINLDNLSENLANKEKSEEILKALKEQYILLRNELNK